MTALINYTIPQRNFEIIRDRIAMILFVELDNQFKRYNPVASVSGVYVERKRPIDTNEITFVTVSLLTGSYDDKTVASKDGVYSYGIDVFAKVASKPNSPGDSASQILMQRLLGICDYILEDPQYRTLAFPPGFIGGILSKQIQVGEQNMGDAGNVAMGRVVLDVRASEDNYLAPASLMQGNTTMFNLEYTNNGYQYID